MDIKDPSIVHEESVSYCCHFEQIRNSCLNLSRTIGLASQFVKDVGQASPGQHHKNVVIIVAVQEEDRISLCYI